MKRIVLLLAFMLLFSACLAVTACAETGTSDDTLSVGGRVAIGILIGFVIALVIVLVMARKMSTVRKNRTADAYVVKNSFSLTESRDIYLYSRVTRVRVNTNKKN